MTSIRVGLVGAGARTAEVTVPTLMSTPGLSLTAIGSMDRSAQELAGIWGVEGVQATPQEFVSIGEFDAVVLASEPRDHEAALAIVAEKGLPVFVEAPVAFSAAPLRHFA